MRFTIRDLLWLTVLAALGIGWWIDRREQDRRVSELENANATLLLEAEKQALRAEEAWKILTETVNQTSPLDFERVARP
jgi:hypothetical protein